MGDLTKSQFLETIHRDDVEWKLIRKEHRAVCRHQSAVPAYFLVLVYDGILIEKYRYLMGSQTWQLMSEEVFVD